MRKNESNRTFDFNKAKTFLEKLYYSAGIPSDNWSKFNKEFSFKQIKYNKDNITKNAQQKWFYKLNTELSCFLEPYLIIIGSTESDKLACDLSFELMKKALCSIKRHDKYENHEYFKVQITNAALIKNEEIRNENIFMLMNVFSECNNNRIQDIRDWAFNHKEYYRIIAMMGNPLTFSIRCGIKPDIIFYTEDTSNFINM